MAAVASLPVRRNALFLQHISPGDIPVQKQWKSNAIEKDIQVVSNRQLMDMGHRQTPVATES